ncbi:MAG: hypothetical protein Q7U48_13905 [Hydrogenophaga sp.]|nr:hypothetical protein [Hydrogenophaga sp.]
MTIAARTIIENTQEVLNDHRGVRYPASLLVRYLNQSQRDTINHRPDVTATSANFALAEGDEQTLPPEASSLIDIPSHATGRKARITKTPLNKLDAVDPFWRSQNKVGEILHFCYDPRDSRTFYTYPPAIAGTLVRLQYSAYPTDVPAPSGNGKEASTVTGVISLADKWQSALEAFVLGYAYKKDIEGAGNMDASLHYIQLGMSILGVQLQVEKAIGPRD